MTKTVFNGVIARGEALKQSLRSEIPRYAQDSMWAGIATPSARNDGNKVGSS